MMHLYKSTVFMIIIILWQALYVIASEFRDFEIARVTFPNAEFLRIHLSVSVFVSTGFAISEKFSNLKNLMAQFLLR